MRSGAVYLLLAFCQFHYSIQAELSQFVLKPSFALFGAAAPRNTTGNFTTPTRVPTTTTTIAPQYLGTKTYVYQALNCILINEQLQDASIHYTINENAITYTIQQGLELKIQPNSDIDGWKITVSISDSNLEIDFSSEDIKCQSGSSPKSNGADTLAACFQVASINKKNSKITGCFWLSVADYSITNPSETTSKSEKGMNAFAIYLGCLSSTQQITIFGDNTISNNALHQLENVLSHTIGSAYGDKCSSASRNISTILITIILFCSLLMIK